MNILITGSSGFIGKALTEHLLKCGDKVWYYDLPEHDIRDYDDLSFTMKDLRIDLVYHLAAKMGTSALNNFTEAISASQINILGTLKVLEAARLNKAKLIYLSKPNAGWNTYSITKVAAQSYCELFHKEYKMPITVFVGYNIFGPGQPKDKVVPIMILKALKNEEITLYGEGQQIVDLISIDEVVKVLALGKTFDYGPYDLGTGKATTVKELAEMIIRLTKSNSKIKYLPMRSGESGADYKANGQLTIDFDLEEALIKTIDSYR